MEGRIQKALDLRPAVAIISGVLFFNTHLANMLQKNQASNPKATHRYHITLVQTPKSPI
jgi:hypothetical protein